MTASPARPRGPLRGPALRPDPTRPDAPWQGTGARRRLLASCSLLALMLGAAAPALAQSPVFARRDTAAGGVNPAAAAMRAAQAQSTEQQRAAEHAANALAVFARAAETRRALDQAQAAARATALQAAPATPVANGLAPGGLVPVLDPALWRGAAAPAQTEAGGRTAVTVRQTESRAILTWQSFNVGRETDLRFDQSAGGTRAREWAVLNRIEDPAAQPSRILGSIEAPGQVLVINRNGIIFAGSSQVSVATLIASALDVGRWSDDVATRDARFRAGLLTPPDNVGNTAPTFSHDRLALLREGGIATGRPRRIAVEVEAGARITLREEGSAILAAPVVANAGSIVAPSGQVILAAGAGLRLDQPTGAPLGPAIGLEAEALRRGAGADTLQLDTAVVIPGVGANPPIEPYRFEARNDGLISAPRGNITLTGHRIANGPGAVLAATTANNRPGSVILAARDQGGTENQPTTGDPTRITQYRFGEVTLGPGSLLEIPAEQGADQVVFNTATAPFEQGRIAILGANVRLAEGAVIRAPAATLRIAGDLPTRLFPANAGSGGRLQAVVLERGSVIDLGGLKDLAAPVARNLVEVQTFRSELADAPLQREGFLFDFAQRRGRVTIDTRIGSQIVNWQPTANSIPVSVAERQGPGGTVEIVAERIFALEGSRIDVSGGLLAWQGGMRPQATRLLGADGRIYDIGTASPDIAFVGLPGELSRSQSRWGITETFRSPLLAVRPVYEAGYIEGFDAGSVTIRGRFYGDGVIQGGAFTGDRQVAAGRVNDADRQTTTDLPFGGALGFLGFRPVDAAGNAVNRTSGIGGLVNPTVVQEVTETLGADFAQRLRPDPASTRDLRLQLDEGAALPEGRFDTQLSVAGVLGRGWSSITIEADGRLTLPGPVAATEAAPAAPGVRLALAPGARLSVNAWSAALEGAILAPGGSIAVTANAGVRVEAVAETLGDAPLFPLPAERPTDPLDGAILVGPQAVLSTRGRWANDSLGLAEFQPAAGRFLLDGGAITLQTRFTAYPRAQAAPFPMGAVVDPLAVPVEGRPIIVQAGAVLDVSGGGFVASSGALTAGRGGTLTLGTYAAVAASPTGAPVERGTVAPGTVGFVIAGPHARPVIEDPASLFGFGTGRVGGGASTGRGGVLALAAPSILLGRAPTEAEAAAGVLAPDLDAFAARGFADIRLTAPIAGRAPFRGLAAGGITVAPGAVIAPVAASRIARPGTLLDPGFRGVPSEAAPVGADPVGAAWGSPGLLPAADRGPMRLTLAAEGALDLGDAATVLRADPGGPRSDGTALISLASARPLLVAGTLEAPAGSIQVTGTGSGTVYGVELGALFLREIQGTEFEPGQALWIASTARLLARGVADRVPLDRGLVAGGVRPGGSIGLQENRGWLVVESGALLDVSGVAGETDRRGTGLATPEARLSTLALFGDAGSIALRGQRGAFLDGTLRGAPGGPGARGATLSIAAPSPLPLNVADFGLPTPTISLPANLPGPFGIVVRQDGPTLAPGTRFGDALDPTLVRTGPLDWTGGERTDRAFFPAAALAGSGIDRLYLAAPTSNLLLEGQVTLAVPRAVQIEAQRIVVTGPLAAAAPAGPPPAAAIATGYLLLNGSNVSPQAPPTPAIAGARLDLSADAIDILGGVVLFGAEQATLAARGDLRLVGAQPNNQDTEFGRVLGRLTAQGDLTLRAAQVYPTTGTNFTLVATGTAQEPPRTLRIEGTGGAPPEAPLSAGGILTVAAARIEQAGVLRVPQGRLELAATEAVELLPGSLTSVSGEGRVVPFGQLVSDQGPLGIEIFPSLFGPAGAQTDGIGAPPEKAVAITAPAILQRPGALIDASGGAELLAFRFLSGPGGTRDVLARASYTASGGTVTASGYQFADRRDVFAILPGAQPAAAPISPYIVDSGDSLGRGDVTAVAPATGQNAYGQQIAGLLPTIGEQIRLEAGIPGLPAGTYTLLPGRYALLPGAFQVVLPAASTGPRVEAPIAAAVARPDGSWLVPGLRVAEGAGLAETRQRLVQVAPAATWSRYTTLLTETASGFYAARAARLEDPVPRLPADAGRLTLSATQALLLEGATRFAPGPGGRGGQAEIAADRIAVTPGGAPYALAGFLPISDAALSGLGVETLTIGGLRSPEATGERLDPRARAVVLASGARLAAPEVVLTARAPADPAAATPGDGVRLEPGAVLAAEGVASGAAPLPLLLGRVSAGTLPAISGDGAVLRVAAGSQTRVLRENLPAPTTARTGLEIGAGAAVSGGSVLVDALGSAQVAPEARFAAATLDLVGNAIVLGDAPAGATAGALALSQGLLQGLSGIGALTLQSRGAIDVHGAVTLAGGAVTLDAAALRGIGGGALSVLASGSVALRNSLGGAPGAAAPGGGPLALEAGQGIRLGGGAVEVSGFGTTTLTTPGAVVLAGRGSLVLPGDLAVTAAAVTAEAGADLGLVAAGSVRLGGVPDAAALSAAPALGGRLAIEAGGSLGVSTLLSLPAGTVALTAGAGDLVLEPGAVIDVAGRARSFFDVTRVADAGSIALTARQGSVVLAPGALLDLGAALPGVAGGGEAGSLAIVAQQGGAALAGATLLGAGGAEAAGGAIRLDTRAAVDLPGLNATLDAGGFFGARQVHSREGDLLVAAGSTMRAREIALTADGGRVAIDGQLDARGPRGGPVSLFGRDAIELGAGATILAVATDPGRPGGTVEIGTGPAGRLLLGGGAVDVGGGDPLRGSLVRLRLPLAGVAGSDVGLAVSGARRVEVEPYVTAAGGPVDQARIASLFATVPVASLRPAIPQAFAITPGVEIAAAGPLGLGSPIDLRTLRTPEGEGGVLTLRATGDLTVLASISDGFAGPQASALPIAGRSWSLRLVGGAEAASADPLATLAAGSGSVLIGTPWTYDPRPTLPDGTPNPGFNPNPATQPITIRTGTGSIALAAAADVLLRDPDATVYTAGRPIADPNQVAGVTADGQAGTGYFYTPVAPTYAAYDPAAPQVNAGDPSVAVTGPAYPAAYNVEGGELRVSAGRDIRAVVLDPAGNNAGQVAGAWLYRQGAVDADTGLYLYRPAITTQWRVFDSNRNINPVPERSSQTSWWVDFSQFQQNFGVLGGGDARFSAGRDFQGAISIPTTGRTGGGLAPSYDFAYGPTRGRNPILVSGATPAIGLGPAVLSVDGGGDLTLVAGRDIGVASQVLLGRGEGVIRAGGALAEGSVGTVRPSFGLTPATAEVGTVIALGDARLSVTAGGSLAASVYDPLQAPAGRLQLLSDSWGHGGTSAVGAFSGYGATSGVTLTALGGDAVLLGSTGSSAPLGPVTALRAAPRGRSGGANPVTLYRGFVNEGQFGGGVPVNFLADGDGAAERLPPNLAILAFDGDIGFQRSGPLSAGQTIALQLEPRPEGQLELLAGGGIARPTITLADANPARLPTPFRPDYDAPVTFSLRDRDGPDNTFYAASTDQALPITAPLRAGDPLRALVYAATGDIERPRIDVAKRIGLRAGRDITDLSAIIRHAEAGDLSFLRAGRDIGTLPDPLLNPQQAPFGNTVEVRGPGRLQVIAGRDIAPIRRATNVANPNAPAGPADNGIRSTGNAANRLLPEGGATIDVLFGVGPGEGIDAAGFLATVLDPAQAGTTYRVEIQATGNGGVTWVVQPDAPAPTTDATRAAILALPPAERLALAIDLHFRELDASGREAAGSSGTAAYARGFRAIASLFPRTDYAGNLNLQNTFIRTEQGGDVNVLGPGGDFFLGAVSGTVDRFPDRVGVLTLNYGSINIFARGDIQAGQSRVITADGGDIFMWSSTADINAGLGSRQARFVPPFRVEYLEDGTRVPDRAGLITGSGIATFTPFTPLTDVAALQRAPASEAEAAAQAEEARRRTTPSISLVAPVGAVDFGDAGVRSAGNLNVAAQTVLNAANVQVAGTSTGVPVVQAPNVAAAVAASAAAGSAAGTASEVARTAARNETRPQEAASVISVEILAFGGSEADAAAAAR